MFILLLRNNEQNQIKNSNQIFIILAVLRRSEWLGPFPRLSAWAIQFRRNVAAVVTGEPLATLCRFDQSGIVTPDLPHR